MVIAVCSVCGDEIEDNQDYFTSPIWDGEKPICSECVESVDALDEIFKKLDKSSKLDLLGMETIYADTF